MDEMEKRVKDESSRVLVNRPLFTLEALPIELLVYIFTFITSTREKVKVRYVSQRMRAAVETPSLWNNFVWPHYYFREERSVEDVLKSCRRYVKKLSFPHQAIHVKSLQYCSNVVRLSLPSVILSVNQLRIIMQSMKKLQYLDILWVSKTDVKLFLLIVGYPGYGRTIKDLTIRQQVRDCSRTEALMFLLNEWTASMLVPQTLNVVSCDSGLKIDEKAFDQWWILFKNTVSQPLHHVGYFKLYMAPFQDIIGLVPIFPALCFEISFMPSFTASFVIAKNYGLSKSERHCIQLNEHITANGYVLHRGTMMKGSCLHHIPRNVKNIEFLTHFSAARCSFFCSEHLEQLAIVCPNVQQLNLTGSVNCLKSLRGLRAIATNQRLEGLNIAGVSHAQLESGIKLWELLVDLQLTHLAIDLCCLLCSEGDFDTKERIISLHQKCLKLKALQSELQPSCTMCCETKERLLLSNFPSLIHFITSTNDFIIGDRLKYLCYEGERGDPWEMANCNLKELCILSHTLCVPDNFMITLSAHGGLEHIILSAKVVTHTGIAALIGNSPNLITCHVYSRGLCGPRCFRLKLKKKYACRKLFLYCFVKRRHTAYEICNLAMQFTMNFVSLWSCSH